MRRAVWTITATSLLALALLSCKQAEGDRCQLDTDCEEGLICCVQPSQVKEGGQCLTQSDCDVIDKDDAGAADAALKEAGADAADDAKVTPDTAPDAAPDTKVFLDTKITPDTKVFLDTQVSPDTKVFLDTQVSPDTSPAVDSATTD